MTKPRGNEIDKRLSDQPENAKHMKKRTRGDGSLHRRGRIWWIYYKHPDGRRIAESAKTERRSVALRLLRKRIGAGANNLPVIPRAEQLTFHDAAKMVIDDFMANHAANATEKSVEKQLAVLKRRINKHLSAYFGTRKLVGITSGDVTAYKAKRLADTIITRKARVVTQPDGTKLHVSEQRKLVSPATVNRELQTLKRMFNLAIQSGRIATKPHIEMLNEAPPRAGFFEREQYESVLKHLPAELRAVVTFTYVTGWRMADEVLPLEWRQVDFKAGEVRLEPGTTKNKEGRTFPFTAELGAVLKAQHDKHLRLKKAGVIFPNVFWRMVAERRGGEKKPRVITSLNKAWKVACKAAGCPGRIPHDMRRSAVRNLVRAGISERVAMMMTGHKTRSVFERYNITSPGDLKDAARLLDVAATRRKEGASRIQVR
jgi:integrase